MITKYDKLLNIINLDNPIIVPYDLTNISFGIPIEDIGIDWNTKITIDSVPEGGYVGTVDLFYKRINLQELGTTVWLFSDVIFTTDLIIELLNSERNAFIVQEDIEQPIIPAMRTGDIFVINLKSSIDSVNYIGNTNASLFMGFPSIANSLSNIMNTLLPSVGYIT